jgi:hypothetical protein
MRETDASKLSERCNGTLIAFLGQVVIFGLLY